jgi:NMD protein affecting ribosome stability and mRNA decay
MTDNRLIFSTGWTPPTPKKCIRCGVEHDSQLYLLCTDCRQDDVERAAEEKDRADTISYCREGY